MRKYCGKSNCTGKLIEKARLEQNLSQEDVCVQLQLKGINIDRFHLYRIEKSQVILKDFELLILCEILHIDYNELKSTIN